MPNYDFHCAAHGIFEAMSSFDGEKVASVGCPKCGELAPVIWRRSPAMRPAGVLAVQVGGRAVPAEVVERELSAPEPDEDAGFWDSPEFGTEFVDALDRNTGRWHAGELPPIQMSESELKTLKEGVTNG